MIKATITHNKGQYEKNLEVFFKEKHVHVLCTRRNTTTESIENILLTLDAKEALYLSEVLKMMANQSNLYTLFND